MRSKWIYTIKSVVGTDLWLLCRCECSRQEEANILVLRAITFWASSEEARQTKLIVKNIKYIR